MQDTVRSVVRPQQTQHRVTTADVRRWLRDVARIDPLGPRAAYYVACWNVREKIARAKTSGQWPPDPHYRG